MQDKKRLSINIIAQIVSFSVQFGINFFLTPFVVKKIGTDAYGFVGLSNTFISYAQVLTVALNSMAGRFIAIEYHQGNISSASRYFTSVFYANVFVALFIGIIAAGCVSYLDLMVNIPSHLIFDVKLLFTLLVLNFLFSIIFSVFNVATFIKNRLDYVAIRSIISNIIRASLLMIGFSLFVPMLWYIGLASVICTLYISFVNIQYKRQLTPELSINLSFFNIEKIKIISKSGIWNSVSRLSNVIEQGFDLLLANLFVGAYAMGQLAITKQIPVVVLTFMGLIGSAFAPSLTQSFANNSIGDMKKEILFSVKLMGFFSIIPLCFIFCFMDLFYELWLPGQKCKELYLLTIISCSYFPILLSLEGAQNLWPVLNKVKIYSVASIILSCCIFVTLFTGLHFISEYYKLYYLAGVSAFYNFLFTLIFIPVYASFCLKVKKSFFYPAILRVILSTAIVIIILLFMKFIIQIDSWLMLFLSFLVEFILCFIIGFFVILDDDNRYFVKCRIKSRLLK